MTAEPDDELPTWLADPAEASAPTNGVDEPLLTVEDLLVVAGALHTELGDAAAAIDVEALAVEAIATDEAAANRFRGLSRDERIRTLIDAGVTRHRLAQDVAYWEGQIAQPLPATVSATPPRASGRKHLGFRSARELVAELPPSIDWAWHGYIAFGAVAELVGRAKAAGKTTLLVSLVRSIVDGAPFLGRPTSSTPVVILSEQPPASLRAALERARLADGDDVRLLLWRDARGVAWRDVVAGALEECERVQARLLIVDTLPAFAGIRGDAENDAGAALAAIEPLQLAAATRDLAIVVVRHERKGGGEVGDSGRGSSAFTGAVDVVIRLGRHAGPEQVPLARPTMRALSVLSRFDETPDELLIELTDDGYVALGTGTAVVYGEVREQLLATLPASPGPGLTVQELVDHLGARRSTIQAALRELLDTFLAERFGTGKRGDPFRFCREPLSPSAESSGIRPAGASPSRGRGSSRQEPTTSTRPAAVGERMAEVFEDAGELEDDRPDDDYPPSAIAWLA